MTTHECPNCGCQPMFWELPAGERPADELVGGFEEAAFAGAQQGLSLVRRNEKFGHAPVGEVEGREMTGQVDDPEAFGRAVAKILLAAATSGTDMEQVCKDGLYQAGSLLDYVQGEIQELRGRGH